MSLSIVRGDFSEKLFLYLVTSSGRHIIGVSGRQDYRSWETSTAKLSLENPMMLQPMGLPGMHMSGENPIQIGMLPTHLTDSQQTRMVFVPEDVEILGNITKDSNGQETCDSSVNLFNNYQSLIVKRNAALRGITAPTASDLLKFTK